MNPEEWDFIIAMIRAYKAREPWNFDDPTTVRILAKFSNFIRDEKDSI